MIAIYARVSTTEQALNGHSIDEQIDRMEKYCGAMGWNTYKPYIDAGFSGANTQRPALQRLMQDVKGGKIEIVLVYKLDRLSRSQKDTLMLIEDVFLANGCDFVSMSENFDTSSPFGRAMIGILSVFAQLEREQIKERMAMGKDARAKMGKFHGSCRVPIGYTYKDGELITDDFEKMQVIKIFEDYSQGYAPHTIAKRLNDAGLSHKYGKWSPNTVRTLLSKKTYLGYIKHQNTWYKGNHEAFINEDLFEQVQKIQSRKSEDYAKLNHRAGKATTFLAGFLECGCCHAKYAKITQHTTSRGKTYTYEYYQCNSRSKKVSYLIKDPKCHNKTWRMEDLDSLVFGEIKKLATDPARYITEQKTEDSRPVIEAEISKLDDQMVRILDLYALGQMPVKLLQDKVNALNEKKMMLVSELDKEEHPNMQDTLKVVQSFADVLDQGNYEEIREILGELIEKIVIDGDDVQIYWRFD